MDENHLPELNQETTMSNGSSYCCLKGFSMVAVIAVAIYFVRKKLTNKEGLRSKTVQIFIPVITPTTDKFRSAISSLCKEISYNCNFCYDIGELLKEVPLVAVCPISSRFEPDIDFAIHGIRTKQFVVLLLHTGLESSLPRLSTASKLAHKDKYKNIEFIDIAYNTDANLYQCDMNETARRKLHKFLFDFAGNK
ncbi:uncharacterized protein LOC132717665 [Ruditapes philippinarum]|uniref:uncharacterized protein LOC132717665 n=1 Tax=Ruditapes philippinarum TaxID=129788 RepID=UPI00295AC077|nr:uncharacterized protein LOC132717665 [Ruditapes philippinarum]